MFELERFVSAQNESLSFTLFLRAAPDEPLFQRALERFFGGTPDAATDARIP